MSVPTNQFPSLNLQPIELQLADVLALLRKDIFLSLNCHHLATIQSFDSANQTARATINYQKTYYDRDSLGNYVPTQVPYPILADCPVICLGGSSTAITFPIAAGDECLVLFNDRDINNWFESGTNNSGILATPALHNFSDGIILVGLRSKPNALSNYNTTHAVIRNNVGAELGVHKTDPKVLVKNNSTSLRTVLNDLISAIESATYGGNPIDSTTTLETVRSEMEGLLE